MSSVGPRTSRTTTPPATDASLHGVRRLLDLAAGCRIHTPRTSCTHEVRVFKTQVVDANTPRQTLNTVRVGADRLVRCGLGAYTNTGGADSVQVDEETDPGRKRRV